MPPTSQAAAQEMLAQVALQRQELTEAAPNMAPFCEAGEYDVFQTIHLLEI